MFNQLQMKEKLFRAEPYCLMDSLHPIGLSFKLSLLL